MRSHAAYFASRSEKPAPERERARPEKSGREDKARTPEPKRTPESSFHRLTEPWFLQPDSVPGGTGHVKQTSFQKIKWAHRFSHGGSLRRSRAGRGARPLTSKEPIHLVFKTNRGLSGAGLRSARRFALVQKLIRKYAWKFHVRIEQVSVQFDHIHLLVRITRRSLFQHFLRVVAGQVAQQFQAHGLGIQPKSRAAAPVKTSTNDKIEITTKPARSVRKSAGPAKTAAVTDTPKHRTHDRSQGARARSESPRPAASVSVVAAVTEVVAASALKLWKHRPFTRVVRGWKAYQIVRDYIQLNEKEATGEILYSSARLRGLLAEDLSRLWA